MNENLRKLSLEARMQLASQRRDNTTQILEKFAGEIVKECVRIAEEQRVKILNNPNDSSWTEHLADVQTNIKNYFGVQ